MKLILFASFFLGYALAVPSGLETRGTIAKRDVTAQEFSSLGLFAQYAAAAQCNYANAPGQPIVCGGGACPQVQTINAKTVLGFTAKITDTRGYIGIDPTRSLIILSFRGSESLQNWITDVLFLKISCSLTPNCKVHLGFAAAWEEVSATVIAGITAAKAANPTFKLIITGHSLGGAVGTLAAAYLRQLGHSADLYTYGSPRVGNEPFVKFVTEQAGAEYRVTHTDDPVPKLPPQKADYRHTSPEYWITSLNNVVASTADVTVCTGYGAKGCNDGTPGFNTTAHVWYFGPIAGCGGGGLAGRSREEIAGDRRLGDWEGKLREYLAMDQE
ncbi:Alpha/Beta hydrolase protein [Apodospora peruviana]|uniref:Alpha/Beta hydrolase protein n=1 Tax=Apodospora peruviana TaxID=516989 RepID=A0AAE0ILR8_9PEZI|nr:Alpha/Beta hydrolase protein [Apodospora peruviana]